MMFLSLDNLAERYGLLPSEAMQRANTFDLYTLDIQAKWQKYQMDKMEYEKTGKKPIPKISQDQMISMLKQARGEK